MLMSGVGRQVRSGGQRRVRVSILHEKGDVIARAVTLISNELQRIGRITERWSDEQRWTLLLTRLLPDNATRDKFAAEYCVLGTIGEALSGGISPNQARTLILVSIEKPRAELMLLFELGGSCHSECCLWRLRNLT
jgi:hypothetical protein